MSKYMFLCVKLSLIISFISTINVYFYDLLLYILICSVYKLRLITSYLTLSYLTLPYLTLPYLTLSYLILSCSIFILYSLLSSSYLFLHIINKLRFSFFVRHYLTSPHLIIIIIIISVYESSSAQPATHTSSVTSVCCPRVALLLSRL